MEIITLILGSLQTNCYILYDKTTKLSIIIDPAFDEENKIITSLDQLNSVPKAILITHGHYDHIGSVEMLKNKYKIPVYASADEAELMKDSMKNLSVMFNNIPISAQADNIIKNNNIIKIDNIQIQCLEVPGHTSGSICYYIQKENILFSGDTLFNNSIGRTDLYEGDETTLASSIKKHLLTLPENTIVYPGHGFYTTIGTEKKNNFYLMNY